MVCMCCIHVIVYTQENGKVKKIQLAELQPDNRFIIDVNSIEGNLNRKTFE